MDNSDIGLRIKELRKSNKITQKALADKINRTESSIRKYEKGDVEIPVSILQSIALALNVDLNFLMYGISLKDSIRASQKEILNQIIDSSTEDNQSMASVLAGIASSYSYILDEKKDVETSNLIADMLAIIAFSLNEYDFCNRDLFSDTLKSIIKYLDYNLSELEEDRRNNLSYLPKNPSTLNNKENN